MRMLSLAALALSADACLASHQDPHEGQTRWHCWYAATPEEHRIACRLLEHGPYRAASRSEARLPAMVRRIRDEAESLEDDIVVIPLFGPPVDTHLCARLARELMCGDRRDCRAEFVHHDLRGPPPAWARASAR